MIEFKEILASKRSISMRTLILGVGINDVNYMTQPTISGKQVICPFYRKWHSMLVRCYDTNLHKDRPTYADCTTCDEWLIFSNFRGWMTKQDWTGKDLDKDLKYSGNKIYSPETCIFVSPKINSLICDSAAARGDYPQGVYYDKNSSKFKAQCNVGGKQKHLGLFVTPSEASVAYSDFKSKLILSVANKQGEPLKGYLNRKSMEIIAC